MVFISDHQLGPILGISNLTANVIVVISRNFPTEHEDPYFENLCDMMIFYQMTQLRLRVVPPQNKKTQKFAL